VGGCKFDIQTAHPTAEASLPDAPLIQAAQNVVSVAVTAGDKIESLRQLASGRCLSADRAGVYSREAPAAVGRSRRVLREPGVNRHSPPRLLVPRRWRPWRPSLRGRLRIESVLLFRSLVILDRTAADVVNQFDVLDRKPFLEPLDAPAARPALVVREPG